MSAANHRTKTEVQGNITGMNPRANPGEFTHLPHPRPLPCLQGRGAGVGYSKTRSTLKSDSLALSCLILCCAVFSNTAMSQPVCQVTVGDPLQLKDSYIYPKLFQNPSAYFLLSFRNPDFTLSKEGMPEFSIVSVDTSFHHIGTLPVKTDLKEYHRLEPLFLDYAGNSFFLFATETTVSTGTARSIAFRLSSRGETEGRPVSLGEISGLGKSAEVLYTEKKDTYFNIAGFYEDSTHYYLFTQRYPAQNQSSTKVMVKVLDTALTPVRHKILNLSVPPEYCEFSDILLAKGELFFILTIQLPFEDKLFKLVTYNFDRDELNYFDFSMEGKKIHSLETVMLEQGNILIRGLYAEPASREEVDGLLYFLFDRDNQTLLSSGSALIPLEQAGIAANELAHLKIRDALVRSNGDVVLISELYWTEVINFSDSEGKLYLRPYYHSDDLLIMDFSQSGVWKWHTWIPREFAAGSEKMLGFRCLTTDPVAYIIFNDHPDNLQTYDPERIKRVKGSFIPVLATVDLETGVYHKYPFTDRSGRKFDVTFVKEYTFVNGSGSMVWIIQDGAAYLVQTTFESEGTTSTGKN